MRLGPLLVMLCLLTFVFANEQHNKHHANHGKQHDGKHGGSHSPKHHGKHDKPVPRHGAIHGKKPHQPKKAPSVVFLDNSPCTGCNACINQKRSDVVAAYRSWGHQESCDSIINDWCSNLDPSSCQNTKNQCGSQCGGGGPTYGICPNVNQYCSDSYQETQTCSSSGKQCSVTCHKQGNCFCAGEGPCCSWGSGSYCDDPCQQPGCAGPPASGGGNVIKNWIYNSLSSGAQTALRGIANTCGVTVTPVNTGPSGHCDMTINGDYSSCFQAARTQGYLSNFEFIWHPGASHCSSEQHLHILEGYRSHGIDKLYPAGPYDSQYNVPNSATWGTCQWMATITADKNWCCFQWY